MTIVKKIKEAEIITCPHCLGKRGKMELLYYYVKCYLCEGVGEMRIDKIIQKCKNGDIKCTFTVNINNANCPQLITKTEWMI